MYFAGAFGTRAWDDKVKGYEQNYEYQRRRMKDHLTKVVEGKEPKELISWFDYRRARGTNND